MTTNKLRRELEELRVKSGAGNCPGCGYPNYKPGEFRIVMKGVPPKPGTPDPPPAPPDPCEVCGRPQKKYVIRMKGLQEKARGDGSWMRPEELPKPLEVDD